MASVEKFSAVPVTKPLPVVDLTIEKASTSAEVAVLPGSPAPNTGWIAVGLALSIGFLASNIALQFGASRLDAHAAALIMLSEIVFASATSVALGAAELTSRTLVGGALILFAAAWSAVSAQ